MCQLETLEAVRKNIISKVRGRVKKDATLGNKVLDMVKKYKEEASNDMKEWNSHLKKRHDDLKPKGMKRKKSKDRKKSKKKKTSSSSSDSSSESQKKKKKTGKSNKEESDDDDEEDEKEEEDEKDDESGSHRDSSTLSLPGTGSVRTGAKGDDDLWLHQKFSRSNSGPKTSLPDDDLQEMLGEVLNEHFKQESESWINYFGFCFSFDESLSVLTGWSKLLHNSASSKI